MLANGVTIFNIYIFFDADIGTQARNFELARSAGLTFEYLSNAPCMGNMEWGERAHGELL